MRNISKYFLTFIIAVFFIQCNKEYDILPNIEGISIVVDNNVKQIGETTVLNLINNEGLSLTNEATFYVNGELIVGNTFAKNEEGSFIVTAKIKEFTSENAVTVRYNDGDFVTFKSHVVVEDYTGTWCGNCPRVVFRLGQIEDILEANAENSADQLIKVAIHRGNLTNPSAANYDPFNFDSSGYEAAFFPGGYPKAAINRTINWPNPQSNLNLVINELQDIKRAGLALETNLVGSNLNVKVKSFLIDAIPDAKLVVYVLENGLIHDQVNYSSLFPIPGSNPPAALSPLVNFVHDHTLRLCNTADMLGDAINGAANSESLKQYNFSIPNNYVSANIEVVAFITRADRKVVNARKIKINQAAQDYQFN